MRAVVIDKNGVRFTTDYHAQPRSGEVPVRVLLAGICETDIQLTRGYLGFSGVLGHEFVGIVEEGDLAGKRVVAEINCACHQCDDCQNGLSNHCPHRTVIGIQGHDGAFADVVYLPEKNLHVVPQSMPNTVAVFTEPLAAALQVSQQVDLAMHHNTVVIGDGRMAYLTAHMLRRFDCQVTVVGKHNSKLAAFDTLGFRTHHVNENVSLREHSLAVDCSGSNSGLHTAMRFLQPRGTLVLKTTVGDQHGPSLAQVVIDEISIIGSRCGPFKLALQHLNEGLIDVESLITGRFPLEQTLEALQVAQSHTQRKIILEVATQR